MFNLQVITEKRVTVKRNTTGGGKATLYSKKFAYSEITMGPLSFSKKITIYLKTFFMAFGSNSN